MGLFSSSSKTATAIDQQDRKQFADNASVNQQAGSVSNYAGAGGTSLVLRNSDGGNANLIFESLDADLAALAIDEVANSVKNTLTEGLGFADNQINKVFKLAKESQADASAQLEATRDFSAGILDKVTETADARLEKFSKTSFMALAALAGLLIWKAV